MPPISPMANIFGRSPFKALQQHMRAVMECAREVPPLFDALCAGNSAEVDATKERIFQKENNADAIKNEMRGHLPKSLFMP
ncbi:MAG: DUF47 family protein, partial [Gammaproteobacteria bacterium]|nr:DUF47 family protein [Gammaproteobacteria bacterium]